MIDPESPLLYFYPEHFRLDQNEKKKDWEAIVLLPFIDEQLLLKTVTKYYSQLSKDERNLNRHLPSLCFKTTTALQSIGNSLGYNPYFPPLKETRALCTEYPIDYYRQNDLQVKHGRFKEKDMINFPKFPILNVLPYKYDYKDNAVGLFESRSKEPTLVLSLVYRPDSDCIKYNNKWDPKNETTPPFQLTDHQLFINRYLGKCVFVNWPHFQHGIVCAISDYRRIYIWLNIPGGSYFDYEIMNNEEYQDYRNYTQTPIYVSAFPFEMSSTNNNKTAAYRTYRLSDIQTQLEYKKALSMNYNYENRQGISIGPIPILLYVSPLIGYQRKCSPNAYKCRTTMHFSNQVLAYPLQTTLFTLPNYEYDLNQLPKTIDDYFKINDPIFPLQMPYYSSMGYVKEVNKDKYGKYSVSCQMKPVDRPNIYPLIFKFLQHQLNYFTAPEVAIQLKTSPSVVAKITGNIHVMGDNKRRRGGNPTNIGLAWKDNKKSKQVTKI